MPVGFPFFLTKCFPKDKSVLRPCACCFPLAEMQGTLMYTMDLINKDDMQLFSGFFFWRMLLWVLGFFILLPWVNHCQATSWAHKTQFFLLEEKGDFFFFSESKICRLSELSSGVPGSGLHSEALSTILNLLCYFRAHKNRGHTCVAHHYISRSRLMAGVREEVLNGNSLVFLEFLNFPG